MKEKEDKEDFRIEPIDGAPISLKKVSDHLSKEKKSLINTYVLIDGTGSGFVNDHPMMANITIEERERQADYFLGLNLPMPAYLRPYLELMFPDENIDGLYKYAKTNGEMRHIIALVQLFGGSLNVAKKEKVGVKIYIEEPETRMHPKREAKMMMLIEKIKKDYGFKEEENGTDEK